MRAAETLTTEFSVLGDGYAEFDQSLLPHRRRQVQEVITFIMSTANSDGLLFWQGQKPGGQRGGDYLAVSLTDGFVEFRYVFFLSVLFSVVIPAEYTDPLNMTKALP